MVRFEKDKMIIEMESHFPTESWVDTMRDLIHCIAIANKELVGENCDCLYGVCELMEAMLPDERVMRKLVKD